MTKATTKTRVFFIATKTKKEPAIVSFYTKRGEPVAFQAVKKVQTKEGVHFYAKKNSTKSQHQGIDRYGTSLSSAQDDKTQFLTPPQNILTNSSL